MRELKEVCVLQSGVYAKSEIGKNKEVYNYLQGSSFNEKGVYKEDAGSRVAVESKLEKHLLKEGDILFSAKGRIFATLFNEQWGKTVASSTFLIIRVKDTLRSILLPEFLCWYLNHPNTMKQIMLQTGGSTLLSISKSKLSEIGILIPPLEQQRKLIDAFNTWKKEEALTKKILERKSKLYQEVLFQSIAGE
jgi:restriction endonuclease S subunit